MYVCMYVCMHVSTMVCVLKLTYIIIIICRSDFQCDFNEVSDSEGSKDTSGEQQHAPKTFHVIFQRYFADDTKTEKDFDPLMELVMEEDEKEAVEGPGGAEAVGDAVESAISTLSPNILADADAELAEMADTETAAEDLEELVKQCTATRPGVACGLEMPSDLTPETVKKIDDFASLQDSSGDSGIGHAAQLMLLESPLIPPPSTPPLTATPLLQRQLSMLTPMTLSPDLEDL